MARDNFEFEQLLLFSIKKFKKCENFNKITPNFSEKFNYCMLARDFYPKIGSS
jgi:hypothetical protein